MSNEKIALLQEIAKKRELSDTLSRIDALEADSNSVVIGFVGEFNAGKSSLINAVLGSRLLPAMPIPTTKSLTEVRFEKDVGRVRYYRDTAGGVTDASEDEFVEIARGKKGGICGLVTKAPAPELVGSTLIDTPGLSAEREDTLITMQFLKELDIFVFCHDTQKGNLTSTEIEFLSNPDLQEMLKRSMFVLTRPASKSDIDVDKIKKSCVKDLSVLGDKSPGAIALLNRAYVVDSEESIEFGVTDRLKQFLNGLSEVVLNYKADAVHSKLSAGSKKIAESLIFLLEKEKTDIREFSDESGVNENGIEAQISSFYIDRDNEIDLLNSICEKIKKKNVEIALARADSFRDVKADDIPKNLKALYQDMEESSKSIAAPLLKRNVSATHINAYGEQARIESAFRTIEQRISTSVTIATAIATAYFLPGAGAAAEAGEALGGAAVRNVALVLAQAAVQDGNQPASDDAANTAPKNSTVGSRIVGAIGEILKIVNPFEHLGSFIEGKVKAGAAQDLLVQIAETVSRHICEDLRSQYMTQVLSPIDTALKERRAALHSLRESMRNDMAARAKIVVSLDDDISSIRNMFGGEPTAT